MSNGVQPVVIQVVKSTGPSPYDRYHSNGARILGFLQIGLALAAILLNVVSILLDIKISYQGYGISAGIFWIIAGSFGVASAKRKTACTIITTLVLSILCAVGLGSYLSLASSQIVLVSEDTASGEIDWDVCGCHETYDEETDTTQTMCADCAVPEEGYDCFAGKIAVSSFILLVGLAELVVSIIQSVLCCRVACCCKRRPTSNQNVASGQFLIVNATNGQQGVGLPTIYQVVPPAHDTDIQKLRPADAPQYTSGPPPAYST